MWSLNFFFSNMRRFYNIDAGLESFSVDMKEKILTLIGDIDPVKVVAKLRKFCHAEIISVGPAKEEKKDEPKDSTKENVINPMFYGADSVEGDPHPSRCVIM